MHSRSSLDQCNLTNLTESLLAGTHYSILKNFRDKDSVYRNVEKCFFEGIEVLVGKDCVASVKDAGLSKLHLFFPQDKIPALGKYVKERIAEEICRLAYDVGHYDLGLPDTFWISKLFIIRIHYPYMHAFDQKSGVAKESKITCQINRGRIVQLKTLLRKLITKLRRDFRTIKRRGLIFTINVYRMSLLERQEKRLEKWLKTKFLPNSPQVVRGIETAAVHGPHLDTWYGLPHDGLTLWWAIDGVTEDSGMLLYPDLCRLELPRSIESRAGQEKMGMVFPKPHKTTMSKGDLLLFRQDRIYHASQLNVSNLTRIVVSTHIAFREIKYSTQTRAIFNNYFSSTDIGKGILKMQSFPFWRNILISKRQSSEHLARRFKITRKKERLTDRLPIAICESKMLAEDQKMLVELEDTMLIVMRRSNELFCFNALCPHKGYNLVYGAHDEDSIFCPGHGVRFKVCDGTSICEGLRLDMHEVTEEEGMIYLRHNRH